MENKFEFINDDLIINRESYNFFNDQNYVPVVYGVDGNFLMHAGVSILSFIENANGVRFHFIVVTSCESKYELSKFSNLLSDSLHALTVVVISDVIFKLLPATKTFTISVYFRLLVPIMFDHYKFILYVDADIIAINSVSDLIQNNMPLNVASCVVKEPREQAKLSYDVGIDEGAYFNSGMMYINTEVWNENSVSQKVYQCLIEKGASFKYFDQDALNIVLHDNVKFIESKYNKQIKAGHTKADMFFLPSCDTVLLHYVGKDKPWQKWNQQRLSCYYKKYLAISPWRDVIFQNPTCSRDIKKYIKTLLYKKSYSVSILWFLRFLLALAAEKLK